MARIQGERAAAILRLEAQILERHISRLQEEDRHYHYATIQDYREIILALEAGAEALRDREHRDAYRRSKELR